MEIFQSFGVDSKLLITSMINFVILLFLLNKILYKPLLDTLAKRKAMIEESITNAEQIEHKLKETTEREREILHQARQEAEAMIAKAEDLAKKRQAELLKKAEEQARVLIDHAQGKLEQQAAQMKHDLQLNVADMVIMATRIILKDQTPSSVNTQYVESVIKELQSK